MISLTGIELKIKKLETAKLEKNKMIRISSEIWKNRETEGESDKEIERHRDIETERHRDRET